MFLRIEYGEGSMIDSHHHIWRQQDLPWLLGPQQPRIFGEYDAIKRDYLIDEYLQDVNSCHYGLKKSVYVQANWAPNWAVDEAAWVEKIAESSGWPHAIVAFADFTRHDIAQQLDRLAEYPLVRGIRQQLHWHENPAYRFSSVEGLGSDKQFQKNIALLGEYGYTFDLQLFPGQARHGVNLAKACPEVGFIVQHALMLEDTSDKGWKQWKRAMIALAKCENVVVKLSGLGTFLHRVDKPLINSIVAEAVSIFGADRCMFGSNFPIEKMWTSYSGLVDAMRYATKELSDEEQQFIFNDTAEKVYRLGN